MDPLLRGDRTASSGVINVVIFSALELELGFWKTLQCISRHQESNRGVEALVLRKSRGPGTRRTPVKEGIQVRKNDHGDCLIIASFLAETAFHRPPASTLEVGHHHIPYNPELPPPTCTGDA